jgi:arginyl-tRNA synthetase
MRIESFLDKLGTQAIEQTTGERAPALLRPANPEHGDYQLNAAMALGKRLGKKPRDIAELIREALERHPAVERADVAGPGFVNLRLDLGWVAEQLTDLAKDLTRDGVPSVLAKEKIVIDFSGPNIAKQMHVGHLRSTIIGEALRRLLSFVGHDVIGDNHLGDWGTQYGLLIVGQRAFGDAEAFRSDPLRELERVYKMASEVAKTDASFQDQARAELAKLQRGDPENLALWKEFVNITRRELDATYERLDAHFDLWLGESAYNDRLPGVVEQLQARGFSREDAGAKVIFWKELQAAPKKLKKLGAPFIVQKSDGAFNYATSDIATVIYRHKELECDRALYVVDMRQTPHFEQVFGVSELLGIPTKLEHISFGTILGTDGKPLKTRDVHGNSVPLSALLDEAERRAEARLREGIKEKGYNIGESDVQQVARVVGIGAVKYADLKQNRSSDYQFDWDKMVAFSGNAGPYLQYAYARVRSIFGKADERPEDAQGPIKLATPEEAALSRVLLRFGEVVHQAAEARLPHLLCDHLYDLADVFSSFYAHCQVLGANSSELRTSRLTLCALTARQLKRGLELLGIQVVERM